MRVVLNELSPFPYNLSKIKKLVVEIGKNEKALQKGELEINFVDKAEMKKINRIYRGRDKSTDVLSFAWKEDEVVKSDYLGQLYLCHAQITKQAGEFGVPVYEEFVRVLTHGLLHMAGYDHAKKEETRIMFSRQEEIVERLCELARARTRRKRIL